MNIEEAQNKFIDLNEEWNVYHLAVTELRKQVIHSFNEIANGGKINPPLTILTMLEEMELKERSLQEKIEKLISSIR